MKNHKKFKFVCIFLLTFFLFSCSSTVPKLSYSGGNYNTISDDIIIYNSLVETIEKISNNLNPRKKILVVQVINNAENDFIADRIFEELYKKGFVVGKAKNLESASTNNFDKFLIFYPTVYGTEHTITTTSFLYWISITNNRQAGVSIHCRLVDSKTGRIDWIKDFTGQSKIKLDPKANYLY